MLLPLPLILQSLFFQLAVADEHWWVVDTPRLTPTQFGRWFLNREVFLVIMEGCGSAHQWARACCAVRNAFSFRHHRSDSAQSTAQVFCV